ncbi:MAG: flagellar protein [Clostridiales bacterium]|jgi:flagellar operon protein|nr:flagellar protein [Clostridiales bacterium]
MNITNEPMKISGVNPVSPVNPAVRSGATGVTGFHDVLKGATGAAGFRDVLKGAIDGAPLQFSKHAGERLSARDIKLSDTQLKRVEDGVLKAKTKGVRDSLVLVDGVALVVNVQNKIVVTALGKGQGEGAVFTNIDGAVIV